MYDSLYKKLIPLAALTFTAGCGPQNSNLPTPSQPDLTAIERRINRVATWDIIRDNLSLATDALQHSPSPTAPGTWGPLDSDASLKNTPEVRLINLRLKLQLALTRDDPNAEPTQEGISTARKAVQDAVKECNAIADLTSEGAPRTAALLRRSAGLLEEQILPNFMK